MWLYKIVYRLRALRETAGLVLINEAWIRLYRSSGLSAHEFVAFDVALRGEFPGTAGLTRVAISSAMVETHAA
mgnify:CR=1 FL=1